MENKIKITVEIVIDHPIELVWKHWTEPKHIMLWCHASGDWHAPYADNDLRTSGMFKTTMAAKDGSQSFDFEGVYTNVRQYDLIEYKLSDGRQVNIRFTDLGNKTKLTEIFDSENINSLEMQKAGWQAILDSFKKYCEANQS